MTARIKYFFDTEFLELGDRIIPISIGLVSESGREFYAEYDTDWRAHASDWILKNVAPHLEGNVKPIHVIRQELIQYVGEMDCEFWAFFAATDWVVLCYTMGGLLNLPKNWQRFAMDLAWLDPTLKRIRAVKWPNLKPHHSLWDSREARQRYLAITA